MHSYSKTVLTGDFGPLHDQIMKQGIESLDINPKSNSIREKVVKVAPKLKGDTKANYQASFLPHLAPGINPCLGF